MIFITGSTGFTGGVVVRQLQNRNIPFCCLVRDNEKAKQMLNSGIPVIMGDVNDPSVYDKAFEDCDGIINIVSFNQEHVPLVLEKATKHNVKRLLFISTTAIFTKLNAKSKIMRTKFEKDISESGLNWSILRPTMIYGYPGDRNMERLIKVLNKIPFHPMLGSGLSLLQPIHVEDLAGAIIDAYFCKEMEQKAVNLSGKVALNYRDTVKMVSKILKKKVYIFPLPVSFAILIAEICNRIPGLPNVNGEQVLRLNEDKNFQHDEARQLFGFDPMSFEVGIGIEINRLKEVHAII